MSQTGARQPPRFVPTLTDVVPEHMLPTPSEAQMDALDSVSEPEHQQTPQPLAQKTQFSPLQHGDERTQAEWALAAQAIQAKVMERVEESLEERLRYTLADVVQMHTQSLYQALREDVEQIVSAAVHEAVAQELVQMRKSFPS